MTNMVHGNYKNHSVNIYKYICIWLTTINTNDISILYPQNTVGYLSILTKDILL